MGDFGVRYRRVRLLGSGGMGEVWLALDEELDDRPVAIKIMHSRMLADAEDAARFQREMRLAARMQHPNIMTVFTTGTDFTTGTNNGVPFMVMEYLQGSDLSKVPPDRDADRAARIGRDACAALAYAHAQGVVHRDIKPGNLFLCDTGLVKVTDFGIAKAISGTRLSATGTLLGTLPYMAPEQWLGEPAAFSNDVWAIGCVLYELLSGRLPRTCATAGEYVAAAARQEPVVPLNGLASVPHWLANAVMAMLAPSPQDRPTAAECVGLLSGTDSVPHGSVPHGLVAHGLVAHGPVPHGLVTHGAPAVGAATVMPPARRRTWHGKVLAAAALAVIAAAGGTAAALAHGTGSGTGNASGLGTGGPGGATVIQSAPAAAVTSPSGLAPAGSAAASGSPQAPGSPAASASAPASSPDASGSVQVTDPAADIWMAQLGSVPVSAGPAAIQSELGQIKTVIPGAQVLLSADYASLNPGYWVVYYAGSFTDGTQALAFCAANGRTSANQCIGRFLSHDVSDLKYACYPPGGSGEASCYRPG